MALRALGIALFLTLSTACHAAWWDTESHWASSPCRGDTSLQVQIGGSNGDLIRILRSDRNQVLFVAADFIFDGPISGCDVISLRDKTIGVRHGHAGDVISVYHVDDDGRVFLWTDLVGQITKVDAESESNRVRLTVGTQDFKKQYCWRDNVWWTQQEVAMTFRPCDVRLGSQTLRCPGNTRQTSPGVCP
jgi:hypothetical protein